MESTILATPIVLLGMTVVGLPYTLPDADGNVLSTLCWLQPFRIAPWLGPT
jgi:hypothetical protein